VAPAVMAAYTDDRDLILFMLNRAIRSAWLT
jgi:hypothetical protein